MMCFALVMAWFSRGHSERRFEKLHSVLSVAFDKIKQETHLIFSWINHFNKLHQEHSQRLARIEQHLNYLPQQHEIRQLIDYHYSYASLHQKIEELHKRIAEIEAKKSVQYQPCLSPSQSRQEKTSNLKEKLVQRISKNSKDYIKTVILSLIKKYNKITCPQLKEIVVDEQGLCSKSSFYRMLEELEHEKEIEVMQTKKEKMFFAKSIPRMENIP